MLSKDFDIEVNNKEYEHKQGKKLFIVGNNPHEFYTYRCNVLREKAKHIVIVDDVDDILSYCVSRNVRRGDVVDYNDITLFFDGEGFIESKWIPESFEVIEEFAPHYWNKIGHVGYSVTYKLTNEECESVMSSIVFKEENYDYVEGYGFFTKRNITYKVIFFFDYIYFIGGNDRHLEDIRNHLITSDKYLGKVNSGSFYNERKNILFVYFSENY